MQTRTRQLFIDGERYTVYLQRTGEICFSRRDSYAEDFETIVFEDFTFGENITNPVKVIRKIVKAIQGLVATYKPEYFWFESNEYTKDKIYSIFVRRFLKAHPEYNYAVDGVAHYFVKIDTHK